MAGPCHGYYIFPSLDDEQMEKWLHTWDPRRERIYFYALIWRVYVLFNAGPSFYIEYFKALETIKNPHKVHTGHLSMASPFLITWR